MMTVKNKWVPYLFLLPAFAGLLLFKLYPIISALLQSMHTLEFLTQLVRFVGFENYVSLFNDPVFWNSLKVTLWFNLWINPFQITLAFGLALLLNTGIKQITFFRGINFIPVAVSVPTAAILWKIMLSPEQGVVNSILVALGMSPQPFLESSSQALASIVAIASWKGVGYWALFLLAGLQEVSPSLYEASSMDGASKWQQFKSVTYPMMKRPLTFVVVSVTVANMLLFAPMYILTKGGPNQSTNVLLLESYNSAFLYSDMGRATAIVVIMLVITAIIVAIEFRILRAKH
ncbi:carbohydrate ABC transporter permease [Pseudogracilibacillus auburnensis]|uniref:Carbohydrate ABC transporter membrane protein 1 (CUT1 family) n=1 Tax=Pseudogracilibacillus auburnensis TaxID=1494959 RepID=A0A2V3W321_9BACI|nr:sugar ABC transporter permease [Pseudogracilibacillus auburnensis]PXW87538.1 carbohydrate ABC transporter membrane protein 1 (CUT1 family) [Pseudogracilibacillus auburnensis]